MPDQVFYAGVPIDQTLSNAQGGLSIYELRIPLAQFVASQIDIADNVLSVYVHSIRHVFCAWDRAPTPNDYDFRSLSSVSRKQSAGFLSLLAMSDGEAMVRMEIQQ